MLNEKDLWFSRFLQDEKVAYASESIKKVVCLSLYVRIIVGGKKLEGKDIDMQIFNCYERNDGRATHIVENVEYGAEYLCLMHKEIKREDESKTESKEFIRRSMKSAAKRLLDQVGPNGSDGNYNSEEERQLNDILCTVISSLDPDNKEIMPLKELLGYVTDVDSRKILRPVVITLLRIPERMETLIALEGSNYSMGMLNVVQYIFSESHNKLNVTKTKLANQFPHIELVTSQFKDVLMKILTQWSSRSNSTKQPLALDVKRDLSDDLLSDMFDWVDERVREIDMLSRVLLSDTGVTVCDSEALLKQLVHKEHKAERVEQKRRRIIILKVDYVSNLVVEQMMKLASDTDEPDPDWEIHQLPDFCFFHLEHDDFEKHVNRVHDFVETAKKELRRPYILLVPSDFKHEDGTEITVAEFLKHSKLGKLLSHHIDIDDQHKSEQSSEVFRELTRASQQDGTKHESNKSQFVERIGERRWKGDGEANDSEDVASRNQCGNAKPLIQMKITRATSGSEQQKKIAKMCAENTTYSVLLKAGEPSIYSLNVDTVFNDGDIRWFNAILPCMCAPTCSGISSTKVVAAKQDEENKVIILIGATGSGKSTLINAIVNYTLGVKWHDPYRFDIIQQDADASPYQSKSQTKSVTAYTVAHQQPGATVVPYSITVIDTPGYEDTEGAERNRKITENIVKFLSDDRLPVSKLHAICVVAASSDSRPTFNQKNVLESMSSIFGSTLNGRHIRLLVTFADISHPPVANVYQVANINGLSSPDKITFIKFNSVALYASNSRSQNDEEKLNQGFWIMGENSFKQFFGCLTNVKGCNMSTITGSSSEAQNSLIMSLINKDSAEQT